MNVRNRKKRYVTLVVLSVLFLYKGNYIAHATEAHGLIERSIAQFRDVSDYTCRLDKRVNKDGTIHEELGIYVKYKKPTHYYFRWDGGFRKGQEAIYVEGKYNDKIVAHSGGPFRFFTLRLDPEGRMAMKKNRHSLRDSGLEKIMHLMEANYVLSQKKGIGTIQSVGEGRMNGNKAWLIMGRFPENQGFYAHRIIIFIDKQLQLPVRISVFDWSDTLVEEYVFRDLRINVGFDEYDFYPENPEYNFY